MEVYHAGKRPNTLLLFICTTPLVAILVLGSGSIAVAGTINGFMEWNYSGLNSSSHERGSESTTTRVDSLIQRYNLSLLTNPLPSLSLTAGGLFEQQNYRTSIQGPGEDSKITNWQPSIDLALLNPVYNAGIGYNRREESAHATSIPATKQINDNYHLLLGWRPLDLPTMELQLTRTNRYDPLRVQEDNSTDRAVLSLRYLPLKNLDLRYQYVYSDVTDKLQQLEIKEITNTGRASYSGQFFDKRVSLFTNYNVSSQSVTTSTQGNGFVDIPISPRAGFFSLSDTPQAEKLSPDNSHNSIIDGNPDQSSGIYIGEVQPLGDNRPRVMGLELPVETEINRIRVCVNLELPPAIASEFKWYIYTSSDNENWTQQRAGTSAPFVSFDKRFDIQFDTVKTRYIKVVTSPLGATPLVNFSNKDKIFVTELEVFLRRPAADVRGKTSTMSQMYSMDVKTKILDTPSLYYNGSFFMTAGGVPSSLRYTLSNGLSINHQLTEKLTLTGRAAREDIDQAEGHTSGYAYDASLRATPLKTVSDTLLYSGRVDFRQAGTATTNSLYSFNSAEIYRGINLNLGGGVSLAKNELGVSTNGTNLLFGMSLAPTKTLTSNLTYTLNRSSQSGGSTNQSSFSTQRGEASLAWRPFTNLYLYTALGFLSQPNRPTDMTQNYGVNWSPFPDGTLQFNFAYNQNIQTQNSERTRLVTPSLTWQITSRIALDSSFSLISTDSDKGKTDVRVVSSNLRINF